MVWIGYALDEVEAREFFEQRFGDFFVKFCTSGQGVVINDVTEILVPAGTAKRLERAAGRANVDFYSQFHLNAS